MTRIVLRVMDFSSPTSVDRVITRVRAYLQHLADTGVPAPRVHLARRANINESVIRNIEAPDWNPTIETLRKLERAIPDDFMPEGPPPESSAATAPH